MPFVIRPFGATDLTNAQDVADGAVPQTISNLAVGDYQVGRIAWAVEPVTVTAGVFTSSDGSTISFAISGAGDITVIVSGSSVAAFNGTYTQDADGNTLTTALIEAEHTICLVKPVLAIIDDIASNGLADPLDTIGLSRPGLWIYDEDQGIPDAPTYQHLRNDVLVAGQEDPAARLLGAADILTSATMSETYGSNTVVSNALAVQDADVLDVDVGAVFWYDADSVVETGGVITEWTDKTGNGHDLDTVPTGATAPVWNAAESRAEIRHAASHGLTTAGNGDLASRLTAGQKITLSTVVDPTSRVGSGAIFAQASGNGVNQAIVFGHGVASGGALQGYFFARRFSNVFGSEFSPATLATPPGTSKMLIRYTIDPNEHTASMHVNGTLELSYDYAPGDIETDGPVEYPAGHRLQLGAIWHPTNGASSARLDGDVYEIFCTTTPDQEVINLIEQTLTTKHGL